MKTGDPDTYYKCELNVLFFLVMDTVHKFNSDGTTDAQNVHILSEDIRDDKVQDNIPLQ